jgi:mannose-6-phosphate isomerase-like protein (cupin superfamily)
VIRSLRPEEVELPRVVDPRYVGESVSKYRSVYASADGALELGFWDFHGEHTTPVHEGYEELLVVLSGTLHVKCEGTTYELGRGELLVYDCPIPSQHLSAPEGVIAAYVMRHRDDRG